MAVDFAVLQHRLFKRDSDMLPILATPVEIARLWLSCADLMSDAQSVVAYRMMGIGGTWSVPRGENHSMLHEKGPAFTEALLAGTMTALKGAGPHAVAEAAIAPLSKKVRSNRKRLAKHGPRNLALNK